MSCKKSFSIIQQRLKNLRSNSKCWNCIRRNLRFLDLLFDFTWVETDAQLPFCLTHQTAEICIMIYLTTGIKGVFFPSALSSQPLSFVQTSKRINKVIASLWESHICTKIKNHHFKCDSNIICKNWMQLGLLVALDGWIYSIKAIDLGNDPLRSFMCCLRL